MSRKSSQRRIEANRRNAQKSTGPRTAEGKAASAAKHGLATPSRNPLSPGCFLHIEDERAFKASLDNYLVTYQPRHADELDLLVEAVYAKWRQQRLWLGETAQIEMAIARHESALQQELPAAKANSHLANGLAHSEAMMKLYLRYDAQLHRHYKSCSSNSRTYQNVEMPGICTGGISGLTNSRLHSVYGQIILQSLQALVSAPPGMGWLIIRAGLRSGTKFHRSTASEVLAKWPDSQLTAEIVAELLVAHRLNNDTIVGAAIETLITRGTPAVATIQ